MKTGLAVAILLMLGCDAPLGDEDGGGIDDADRGQGGGPGDVGRPGDVGTDAGGADGGAQSEPCGFDWSGTGGDSAPPRPPDVQCDALDPSACALPWPSNQYLHYSDTTGSGQVLSFGTESLPGNINGVHPSPVPFWRLDGYSAGTQIVTLFPNLEITGIAGENDIEASMDEEAPVLLYRWDQAGLTRVPYFAELDAQEQDAAKRVLFVRPAEQLQLATRHIVAFRGLTDTGGAPIPPSEAFAQLRDGATEGVLGLESRQRRFDAVLDLLEAEGVDRGTINLAWDFVTQSDPTRAMRHMRDTAFELVGPNGPQITIDAVEEWAQTDDGSGKPVNPYAWLRLHGTIEAPHFMCQAPETLGERGWIFNDGFGALEPDAKGTRTAEFYVMVPHSARDGRTMKLVEYGHGQFGDAEEVFEPGWDRPCGRFDPRECGWWNARVGHENDLIFFGAALVGMSEEDFEGPVQAVVQDVSLFPWISDRLHQGLLEYLLLARSMKNQFGGLPEITDRGITVDDSEVTYSGISQGGIFGASVVALSPDIHRGHLGVPGQNYSMYLHRSRNFEQFFAVVRAFYPSSADQAVILNMIQLLWDGTENAGYLRHIATPFQGQPANSILVAPVKGDRQVPPISMDVAARTPELGIPVVGTYDTERLLWGAETVDYPHTGSGLVMWGQGDDWAAPGNMPGAPVDPDPHEDLRHVDAHGLQMAIFLKTGEIVDVCGDSLCHFSAERPPPASE